eukprot:8090625-Heterocapsa_arctica.AAC.1
MEATQAAPPALLEVMRQIQGTHAQAKSQAKPQPRKQQAEATLAQEARLVDGKAKQAKKQHNKNQEAQLTPKEAADQ